MLNVKERKGKHKQQNKHKHNPKQIGNKPNRDMVIVLHVINNCKQVWLASAHDCLMTMAFIVDQIVLKVCSKPILSLHDEA